jgi:peptidoglycan hydrolase CwlO-like protein
MMEERMALSREPRTAAEYRAAIDELLAEMQRMNERSKDTWTEIERLKTETETIKAEIEMIKARVQARLDDLLARV